MKREIPKPKKNVLWSSGKLIILAEAAAILYAYSIYYKLNRYQDFRYKYSKSHPWILDKYYRVGEMLDGLETRKQDQECWSSLENEQNKPKS